MPHRHVIPDARQQGLRGSPHKRAAVPCSALSAYVNLSAPVRCSILPDSRQKSGSPRRSRRLIAQRETINTRFSQKPIPGISAFPRFFFVSALPPFRFSAGFLPMADHICRHADGRVSLRPVTLPSSHIRITTYSRNMLMYCGMATVENEK